MKSIKFIALFTFLGAISLAKAQTKDTTANLIITNAETVGDYLYLYAKHNGSCLEQIMFPLLFQSDGKTININQEVKDIVINTGSDYAINPKYKDKPAKFSYEINNGQIESLLKIEVIPGLKPDQCPGGAAVSQSASNNSGIGNSESLPYSSNPQMNTDDTISCINVLCSGKWVLNHKYMMDTTLVVVTDLLKELYFKNNGDIFKHYLNIHLTELEWVFYKNHTYKIIGKSIISIDQKETQRDSTISGTWTFDKSTTGFFGGDYNVKIRNININEHAVDYHCLELVSASTTMPYWDGSGEDYKDVKIQSPFLDNKCVNAVWTHLPL